MPSYVNEFADLIQSISIILTCATIILGVDAWRREFVGKRKIELAEDILILFYEARDAISRIRSPFGHSSEGNKRERQPEEDPSESKVLDKAYVVFVRYEKESEIFNRLHALRYRAMARIAVSAANPFVDLQQILKDIFLSAHMLGNDFWQRQGRVQMSPEERERHLKEMHAHEAVFWEGYDPSDPIKARVEKVITDIESIFRPVIEQRPVGFILTEPISQLFSRKKK